MTLGFVAAILCLGLVLAGASMGLTGARAFSQPSPSGSPSGGGGPKITLLNPSPAYDPAADVLESPPDATEPSDLPKISDKFDGTDEAYHVVALVADAPPDVVVEAYYQEDGLNEITAGQLSPVPGSVDTYELFWNVPTNVDSFFGTFTVRMFAQTPQGFEEIANDAVQVRMQHQLSTWVVPPEGPVSAAETVEILWPSQNGPLGFFKSGIPGAAWRTVVEGTTSHSTEPDPESSEPGSTGADQVRIFYTTTPIGSPPEFKLCATDNTGGGGPNGAEVFAATCTLQGTDRPTQVKALAAVAMQDHDPSGPNNGANPRYSQESADVHRVQPYLQRVEDMDVEVKTEVTAQALARRHSTPGGRCIAYKLTVKDLLDRPVQGANVDVHVRGPVDQMFFGTDTRNGATSSGKQRPQKEHSGEGSVSCQTPTTLSGEHGDHNLPGAADIKHIESNSGTGLSGGATVTFGQWLFLLFTRDVGDTDITVWIDEEPVPDDQAKRELDDDVLEGTEASDTNFAQWLSAAPALTIDPQGATAATGECQRFVVRARGGTRPVRGANIDVHAVGPTNELDFCDPADASPRRAPDAGTGHNAEDEGEMSHAGQPPVAQHTEGETNEQGNFVIGVRSPDPGDTTLTAWYDSGEPGSDNDEPGEASATATTNWIQSTGDAAISFLNPSGYGSAGTNVAKTRDVDDAYHVVVRVSSVQPVPGVELLYRSGTAPLVKIADAARVGQTDTWEAYWPVDVADGSYTLVARIRDTNVTAEQAVTVQNEDDPIDPTVTAFETAELTSPLNGTRASFVRGRLQVRGIASAGAEGVVVYYTKAGPIATPAAGAWTQCATSTLPGGSAPQEFTLECALAGADQPALVTGVAAVAYNCFQGECGVDQANNSGDAHRVIGAEANPLLTIEPAETAADTGACVKFVVDLRDQTGQPIPDQNVDVHLTGPGNSGNFCAPTDGTGTPRRAPELGSHTADGDETDEAYHDEGGTRTHHTEGETTANGRLIFGIESETAGDAQLTVWLDSNDDDLFDQGETNDISVMHWEAEATCDITGTNGPDVLEGSGASEKICGFGGNDTIRGGGGNDVIGGGAGRDELRGNAGNDRVNGGAGRDRAFGGQGSDRVSGGGGPDVVNGHRSNDRLRGNRGNDRLNGGPGRDDCSGGGGRDRLRKCETGRGSFAARIRPI